MGEEASHTLGSFTVVGYVGQYPSAQSVHYPPITVVETVSQLLMSDLGLQVLVSSPARAPG